MTEVPPYPVPVRQPFPFERMFFAFGFAVLAWVLLWGLFIAAIVQFVFFAVEGRANEELRGGCQRVVQYLWEVVAYVVFVRDEKPFPFAPFPKHA